MRSAADGPRVSERAATSPGAVRAGMSRSPGGAATEVLAAVLLAAVAFTGCDGREEAAAPGGGNGGGQPADTTELAEARQEVQRLQEELDEVLAQAREEERRLQGELDAARRQVTRLEGRVRALEDSVARLRQLVDGRAPDTGREESGPGVAPDTLEGTVRQVGSTPFQRTVIRGEEASAAVTGPYEEEIARLVGARVRVVGAYVEGGGPARELEVSGYEVLSVDGETPAVGLLRHGADRGYYLETADGEEVSLAGVPERLRGMVGAKIWVVRGEEGGVLRYGVLKEP